MYVIEGEEHGFTSIPTSIYWAIVTLTTVGYGDLSPRTPIGKTLASIVMIIGYGIIAVPTGIVSVELAHAVRDQQKVSAQSCPKCGAEGHDPDAVCCALRCDIEVTSVPSFSEFAFNSWIASGSNPEIYPRARNNTKFKQATAFALLLITTGSGCIPEDNKDDGGGNAYSNGNLGARREISLDAFDLWISDRSRHPSLRVYDREAIAVSSANVPRQLRLIPQLDPNSSWFAGSHPSTLAFTFSAKRASFASLETA